MGAQLPLLLSGGTGSPPEVQTLRLSEEAPRRLKRFGPSNLIVDQVPDFINKDHETFRRFVEVYYEWLEQYQNAFGIIDAFTELTDIDQTIGLFFLDFRQMYLQNFPLQLAIDSNGNVVSEANFLKNVRNFYGAKGTEKSFRFLFRLIYNVASEIRYPGEDILKCSHGKWIERKSIKTTSNGGTANFQMAGQQVFQIDEVSGDISARAISTDVVQYTQQYYNVTEIFLKDIFGTFEADKPVYCDVGTVRLEETIQPVITEMRIVSAGSGYHKSDVVKLITTSDGIGAAFSIDLLSKDNGILGIRTIDSGIDYSGNFDVTVISNSGSGAVIVPVVGAVTNYTGYYANNDGKLSSNKRLFDADYYQDFSYALRSEISFIRYKEMFKALVHPAGFKMFGEVLIKRNLIDSLPFHSEMQRYEIPYIGHYTPYRMGTTADLYNKYINGFNPRGDTYSSYQAYGRTGGKLFITPVGFTFNDGVTWVSAASTGSGGNIIGANIFSLERLGQTLAVVLLKEIDFDILSAGFGGTGFSEGVTLGIIDSTATTFNTTIQRIRNGVGIVYETTAGQTHDPQGLPLGASGSYEGYIEAQGFSYAYWKIYHHPNTRGIKGLTGVWDGGTGLGSSFGAVALNPFFRMPIGYHFHSNPTGTSYVGTTGSNNEYGLIESTTLTSPNF